jgi:hypothetical protein
MNLEAFLFIEDFNHKVHRENTHGDTRSFNEKKGFAYLCVKPLCPLW